MNKIKLKTIALLFTLSLCGCQSDEFYNPDDCEIQKESPFMTPKLGAITSYIKGNRTGNTRGAEVAVKPYVVEGDTVLYIVNYPGGGFEVFTNNTSLPMVIFRSGDGTFNPGNIGSNSSFADFFNSTVENIRLYEKEIGVDKDTVGMWRTYSDIRKQRGVKSTRSSGEKAWLFVGKAYESSFSEYTPGNKGRLKTKWDQDEYYNLYVPYYDDRSGHSLVGCNAVAAGQFLYFTHNNYGKPATCATSARYDETTNTYTFSNYNSSNWRLMDDGSDPNFRWDEIKMQPTALFLGDIAKSIFTIFAKERDPNQGSVTIPDITASYINYHAEIDLTKIEFNVSKIKSTFGSGYPILIVSWTDRNKYPGDFAHTHILDYLKVETIRVYDVYAYLDSDYFDDPRIEIFDPIINPGEYGPSLDEMTKRYGQIQYESSNTMFNYWVRMNWGYGGNNDEVEYNAQLNSAFLEFKYTDKEGTTYPLGYQEIYAL